MTSRMKILISDDSKDFFSKCSAILSAYGCEAVFAPKDGDKICEIIREQSPDIVLMEAFMPYRDALTVVKDISSDPSVNTPQFMVILNYGSATLERELTAAGVAYLFLKPVEIDVMVERILQIFENRSKDQWDTRTSLQGKPVPDLKVLVTGVIHQVGVPAHIKGYHYVRDSIILAIKQPDIINSVTKQLYPTVAKKNSSTPSRVERAIRHAIEVAWDRGDVDVLNSYFGYTIHNGRGKPTNSEFIAMISDRIRLQLRSTADM